MQLIVYIIKQEEEGVCVGGRQCGEELAVNTMRLSKQSKWESLMGYFNAGQKLYLQRLAPGFQDLLCIGPIFYVH